MIETWEVTIPAHEVRWATVRSYAIPAWTGIVAAATKEEAVALGASNAHRAAKAPPFRSLMGQTLNRAKAVRRETAKDKMQARLRR